ncbi:hypothetical protein BGX29_006200 [Mortierella sp. GBA35]|nr:hypothetical protein BGX29_006200 [Mortierella sp. GBA35]
MAETTTQDVGLVEQILEKRVDMDTGAVQYLIRWQGTDSQGNEYEDTWEPEENVLGVELIVEFEQSRPTMSVHARQPSSTKPNGAAMMPPQTGESHKHHPSVRYPHPPAPGPPLPAGANRHPRTRGWELYPDSHLAQSYPPHWKQNGASRRANHQDIPYGAPAGYYPPRHAPPYPSMDNQPPFSGQFPLPHHPLHSPYGHTGSGGQLSKRDRSAANLTTPSKRKASPSMADDSESKDMSGVESTADLDTSGMQGTGETDKRLKAEQTLRSYNQAGRYISRRQAAGVNGKSTSTIRLLQLDHDRERAYFKAVIEKSDLIKDVAFRSELLQFLDDPKCPGFDAEAALLRFETWLIELKEQQETPGSLFLALDVPNAIIKALFIPETLLEYQRQQHPEKGLILNDRSTVTAIIAGDLRGSGLSSVVKNESGSTGIPSLQSRPSDPVTNQADMNGDVVMEVAEPVDATSVVSCGWKDCNETRATVQELSLHVQQDHLQSLESRSGITQSKVMQNGSDASLATTSPSADASQVTDSSRDDQIVQLQSSYSSLKSDLVEMKEKIMRSDQQAKDLSTLYASAIETSEENIKRLEAQLEWEMKKWDQYRKESRRMMAFGGNSDPAQEPQPGAAPNDDVSSAGLEQNGQDLVLCAREEDHVFDKPMEAQSQNSILAIQKLLITAREKQARLEKQNQELVSKRQALVSEHALLDQRYQETLAQLSSLVAKDHDIAEALKTRAKGVEQCRATIDQEQEQSRRIVGELQSKIDELRQSSLTPHPRPQQQQQHSPSSSTPNTQVTNIVHESDTNGDHIMAEPSPSPKPSSSLPAQAEPSEELSAISLEPPAATDSVVEPADSTLLEPANSTSLASAQSPPEAPQSQPRPQPEFQPQAELPATESSPLDEIASKESTSVSVEQPLEESNIRPTQPLPPPAAEEEAATAVTETVNPALPIESANLSTTAAPVDSADPVVTATATPDEAAGNGPSTLSPSSTLQGKVQNSTEATESSSSSSPSKASMTAAAATATSDNTLNNVPSNFIDLLTKQD